MILIRVCATLIARLSWLTLWSSRQSCQSPFNLNRIFKKNRNVESFVWSILPTRCPHASGHLCQTVWRSDGPLTARKGCLCCVDLSRGRDSAPLRPRGSPTLRMRERFPLRCGLINANQVRVSRWHNLCSLLLQFSVWYHVILASFHVNECGLSMGRSSRGTARWCVLTPAVKMIATGWC